MERSMPETSIPVRIPEYDPAYLAPLTRSEEEVRALHRRYWDEGLSYGELGVELGISREAVRQLFKKYALPTRTRAEAAAIDRHLREHEAEARREEIEQLYMRHGMIDAVFEETRLPRKLIRAIVKEMPNREAYRRTASNLKFDRETLLDHLRLAYAHNDHKPFGILLYGRIASELGLAGYETIVRYFELEDATLPWIYALEQAGVPSFEPRGPRPGRTTPHDCVASVAAWLRARKGRRGSFKDYETWAYEHPNEVSGASVRKIVGWNHAVEQAFEQVQ